MPESVGRCVSDTKFQGRWGGQDLLVGYRFKFQLRIVSAVSRPTPVNVKEERYKARR